MHKVLLIEDDTAVRENTAEILELSGYEVITAPNGKIGVAQAKENLPDIIICDIMMPELDGYGVLKELASDSSTKYIPFVFLSAKTEHKDIRKGMDMGADDYLTKPFEENELISALESRLAKTAILKEKREQKKNTLDDDSGLRSLNDLKNYLDDNGKELKFKKGELIFEQGYNSNYIYLINKGIVKCHKIDESGKELTTALFKEDDLFGYASLMQNIPYQESATAMENCELVAVSKDELKEVLNNNHKVNFDLINLLSDNLAEIKDQLLQMAYGSVRKKTAATILQFADKMNKKKDESIKISRSDLASVAGIATESLIRTLSSFNKEGIIEIEGRNIKILDMDLLRDID
ncbi:response regulator [Planktosalinus lacus]|uniref:Transcriptional regulator n=1 Tax=Planktosalinus lacus TaxID=1526573 RepID=A0A8J2V9U2_9FLAO|nr:response regulator [Planktosalinus lacus]GGD91579.1 transcriptional regulator [Planktosalinus lacus]